MEGQDKATKVTEQELADLRRTVEKKLLDEIVEARGGQFIEGCVSIYVGYAQAAVGMAQREQFAATARNLDAQSANMKARPVGEDKVVSR